MVGIGGRIKKELKQRKWKLKVKTWVLILMLIPLCATDAYLLRQNHIKMTELRDAVLATDIEENDEELAIALERLQEFVLSEVVVNVIEENGVQHLTFGTGPFYLEHLYIRAANRALEQAREELSSDSNPNGNIYGASADICDARGKANGWIWSSPEYINCMLEELQAYPTAGELQDKITAKLPSTDLYRRNYVSRVWAPTLTGWMLLATAIVIVVIFIRMVVAIVLRLSLLFI